MGELAREFLYGHLVLHLCHSGSFLAADDLYVPAGVHSWIECSTSKFRTILLVVAYLSVSRATVSSGDWISKVTGVVGSFLQEIFRPTALIFSAWFFQRGIFPA